MTKKLFSKIVSAILVMAICLTTVFGCLITVNAADATGTYTITSDEVPSGARTATTYVTLTSDTGFSSGKFDLMFHDNLLDKDENGNVYEDGVTVLPTDTNGDGMISAYNVYELDAKGNIVLDEENNKVVKEVIKENATNSGTRLPNAYDEKYVDTNDDGKNDDIVSNLYDTKIEIYSATATDGTELDVDTAFTAPQDDTTGFDKVDDRNYKYVLLDEYKNYEASGTQLEKYSRSYSHIDVVTSNLSYDISTVSDDSTGLVGRYCQYAQGFKNVSFDAGANTCKSITFKVTFDFLGRSDRMSANAVATETSAREDGRYCGDNQVQLGLNYILTLTPDSETAIAGFKNTNNDYRKSNFHIHFYNTTSRETDVISSGKDYTVYQGYCGNCSSTASSYKAPMIADAFVAARLAESAKTEDNGIGKYYFHNYKNIYGFNVVYEDDGTLSVNIHFDQYNAGDTFVIGLSDGTKIAKYEDAINATTPETSFFSTIEYWDDNNTTVIERDVRPLRTSGKMVTIKGLSAKDIDTELYIARMGNDGTGAVQIGRTHVFSLADYCMKVINGENVYYYKDETVANKKDQFAESDEAHKQNDKNVAAALINYGKAAKKALETGYDGNTSGVTWTYDGTPATAFSNPVGTGAADSPIIINSAKELAYLAQGADGNTAGKYYKIADGVSNIVLQKADYADEVMALGTADAVREYFETTKNTKTKWLELSPNSSNAPEKSFAGIFDGNGAIIYGFYSDPYRWNDDASLFPWSNAITVKNLTIKNSYVLAENGAMITGRNYTTGGTYTVENCAIYNNVIIDDKRDGAVSTSGVAFGYMGDNSLDMSNCIVYGNIAKHQGYYEKITGYDVTYGLWGIFNNYKDANDKLVHNSITNSIILDCAPYTLSYGWNRFYYGDYENVYTNMIDNTITITDKSGSGANTIKIISTTEVQADGSVSHTISQSTNDATPNVYTRSKNMTGLKKVTAEQVLGNAAVTNCPALDWSKWSYGLFGEYPTPASPDAITDRIEYWDGSTSTAPVDSDGDGVYEITSAANIYYLAKNGAAAGNSYKVVDGIKAFIMQPQNSTAVTTDDNVNGVPDILELADYSATKTYFERTDITFKPWANNGSGSNRFLGTFDGNGAEIYGMYYKGTWTCTGLFPTGGPTTTIKNVAVRNSYFQARNYVGALLGQATTSYTTTTINADQVSNYTWTGSKLIDGVTTYSAYEQSETGVVTIDGCEITNCYILNNEETNDYSSRVGVMIGNVQGVSYPSTGGSIWFTTATQVNNAIVYGSKAFTYKHVKESSIYGSLNNQIATAKLPAAVGEGNYFTNMIVLDTAPYAIGSTNVNAAKHFVNVYTNDSLSTTKTGDRDLTGTVTIITDLETLKGKNAQSIIETINAANGNSRKMYVGAIDGYPGFNEVPTITTNLLGNYVTMQFAYDKYGESTTEFGMYATSLNLKVNPYMAFTFAFAHGTPDYKANRDNITVTFKTASNTITTTVGNGNGGVSGGWTNNEGAGRYHLYRLKDITVEDMYKGIEVTVNYEGKNYDFGTFSVGGFVLDLENAYKADPCQYYATRVEAAKALLFYTQMINARYA